MSGPLADLRVLDLSAFLPGPFCAEVLADLGADVIKVEPPGGEPARSVTDGLHAVANRNKRGTVADLKDPVDRARVLDLAGGADVLIEGFRPGVVARLGVAYSDVCAVNPGIVYCSVTGYGQDGPKRDRPAHDLTLLAAAGALSFSPHWHGAPRRSGVPVADLAGATYAVIAILAALRDRDRTGRGCYLDVALADATLSFIAPRGGPMLDRTDADRLGVYPTNDIYPTADGRQIAISAVEQKFWLRLRDALAPDAPAVADPCFDTPGQRHRTHGNALAALLTDVFATRRADEWIARLEAVDVCVELVRTVREAAESPQVQGRGIVQTLAGEHHVVFPVVRDGAVMGRLDRRAPNLVEDRVGVRWAEPGSTTALRGPGVD
ncbi:CaiB/BaiF CoA transferase family protein [Pseudonocardia sp. GCM10023141]|uniref:CaiB/BaiF CoA transferase family protein n=1 Tax=Pseudonocardia sp. GCM10023141 TaxID=3252653 RepID=UPI003614A798